MSGYRTNTPILIDLSNGASITTVTTGNWYMICALGFRYFTFQVENPAAAGTFTLDIEGTLDPNHILADKGLNYITGAEGHADASSGAYSTQIPASKLITGITATTNMLTWSGALIAVRMNVTAIGGGATPAVYAMATP